MRPRWRASFVPSRRRALQAAALYAAGPGFFVEPTIIRNARNDWPVVQRETFAPILYVIRCRDLPEAISLHNAVPQGLSSAIFTRSLRDAEAFLSTAGSDCGIRSEEHTSELQSQSNL